MNGLHIPERGNRICGVVAVVGGGGGVGWGGMCPHESFIQKAHARASLLIFNCNWAYVLHMHIWCVCMSVCVYMCTQSYM